MLTVVTYLWQGGRGYQASHVQRLARSVEAWLDQPHRFVCVTDEPVPGVETIRTPQAPLMTRCYRRLWLFSEEARTLGDRLLHLDLDVVVCGALDPLVSRPADFSIYRAGSVAAKGYSLNPSVFCLTTGTQTDLWERFVQRPQKVASAANQAGFWGSDQAVISYLRQDPEPDTIGDPEGVVSFRRIRSEQLLAPPTHARIVSFHGKRTPFEPEIQVAHPWIRQAWAQTPARRVA